MDEQPHLEPQALELRPDDNGRIQLSVAISLKRIADALEQRKLTAVGSSLFATASSVTASATATALDNSGSLDIRAVADDAA